MKNLYRYLLLMFFVILPTAINAQINTGAVTGSYSQTFDAIAPAATVWSDNTTVPGWYSNRTVMVVYATSSTTGGLYNAGTPSATDRALGALTSGSTATVNIGLLIKNTSAATITDLKVSYKGEQWRQTANAHKLVFDYVVSASQPLISATATGTVTALDFTAKTGTAGALDGNVAGNFTTFSNISIPSLSLAPGSYILLRWTKTGSTSPLLAIDDVTINWTVPAGAYISPSVASLTGFNQISGSASAEQSFTCTASGLATDVTVTAPTGFEVSDRSGSNFGASVSLPISGGTLVGEPVSVYVRLNSGTPGAHTGDITLSDGATNATVSLSGSTVVNYYSKSSGSLDDVGTWGTAADGTGSAPTDFTSNGQVFIVANQASATIGANWTVSGTSSKIVVGNGAGTTEFVIPAANTVTGTIDVANHGTLSMQNTTIAHTYGTLSTGSTLDFAQAGSYTVPTMAYKNLKVTNGTKTLPNAAVTIAGDFTADNVTLDAGASSPFTTLNVAGNVSYVNTVTSPALANSYTLVLNGNTTQNIASNGNILQIFRLTTSGTSNAVLTPGSNTTISAGNGSSGGYSLASGTTCTVNDNTIALTSGAKGFFQQTGTFTCSATSNFILNTASATGAGTIYLTTGGADINNFTLNATGAVTTCTLATTATVHGAITLTAGKVIFASGKKIVMAAGSTISESAGNEVVGDIDITRTINAASENFGGLGVTIDATANSVNLGSVSVTRTTGTAMSANSNSSIKRSWLITPASNPTGNVNLTLSWISDDDNSKTLTNATVWQTADLATWNGMTNYADLSSRTVTLSTNALPSGGSYWTVSDNATPLPVELTSFEVKTTENGVDFKWVTATEHNSNKFVVEALKDNIWSVLGEVKATGNSNVKHSYSYSTSTLAAGKYQFRVKMVDNDGAVNYSNIVNGEVSIPSVYELSQNYPNPFNPSTMISYRLPFDSEVELSVYSQLGEKVTSLTSGVQKAGTYSVSFNTSSLRLSSGIYLYVINARSLEGTKVFNDTKKMILVK